MGIVDSARKSIIMIQIEEGGFVPDRRKTMQHDFSLVTGLASQRKVVPTNELKNKLGNHGITLKLVCETIAELRKVDYRHSVKSKMETTMLNHKWQDVYITNFDGSNYYIKLMVVGPNGDEFIKLMSFKPDGAGY